MALLVLFGSTIFLFVQVSPEFNPLMGTLKPHSNGPLYSDTVIATLAVDGWTVALLAVPNVTVHSSTASIRTSYYSMWQHNCLCTVKG